MTEYRYEMEPLDRLSPRAKRWLWDNRIPRRKTTFLVGQEGLGKGLFECWLIAALTLGTLQGELLGIPINVCIVTNEDDTAEDLWPRLRAAGADLAKVFQFRGFKGDTEVPVILPGSLDALSRLCVENSIVVVIIDPMLNHMSIAAEANRDFSRTTQVLSQIQSALETVNAILLATFHYNKSQATPGMLDRLIGSKALATFPRAILGFGYDPEDPQVRLILQAKNSGGDKSPRLPTLAFTVRVVTLAEVDEEDGRAITAPVIHMETERDGLDPAEFFSLTGDEMSIRQDARDYLLAVLWCHQGHMKRDDAVVAVQQRVKASTRTVRRAYDALVDRGWTQRIARGVRTEWTLTEDGTTNGKKMADTLDLKPEEPEQFPAKRKAPTKRAKREPSYDDVS